MKFIHYFLIFSVNTAILKCHILRKGDTVVDKLINDKIQGKNINKMDKTRNVINISKTSYYFNLEYYREKRKVRGNLQHRWFSLIPVYIDEKLNRELIIKALNIIQTETCVRFKLVNRIFVGMSGIRYRLGERCASFIGRSTNREFQDIFVAYYCQTLGVIQHETLHALGIDHEHNRIDRNQYVTIMTDNVDKSLINDFSISSKLDSNTFGLPYDYGSIMHYDMDSFTKNKGSTIIPKHELYRKTIGQVEQLSFIDIKTVNMMYCQFKCSSSSLRCFNSGFLNPNYCDRCKCVEGFTGIDCGKFVVNEQSCGKTRYIALRKSQEIKAVGKINCFYHLLTQRNSKIGIKIIFVSIHPYTRKYCSPNDCLEIKYWQDKTVTGARFCGINKNIIFYSKNNVVLIYYRSTDPRSRFKLIFKKC
uniref:Metalloendopeptidase n=1 Tax=Strongyloides venezuelensis TaxID=75913 RepID=A0A0K0F136_STRVS